MLNKLQKHIEQEEIDWRNQLKAKEAEIETLKEKQIKQVRVLFSDVTCFFCICAFIGIEHG